MSIFLKGALRSKFFVIFAVLFFVSSCSSEEENNPKSKLTAESAEESAEFLFNRAKENLNSGRYRKAIEFYQEVERLYPFSELAPRSKVMTAYAHYKNEDYDEAISVIDNFVSLNPGNAEIDFMYHLKAISYYDRIKDIKRDQEVTVEALKSFREVIRRFPDSEYTRDAKYKIDLIRDHLAGKEMEIGRFYQVKKKYVAALNRFKEVVNEFDDTNQIEEALFRLVETNLALGFGGEANKYASILGHNYQNGRWYKKAYSLLNTGVNGDSSKSFFGDLFKFGDEEEGDITTIEPLHSSEADSKLEKLFENSLE